MLETLEFRGNTLGVDASIPIADALQSKPRLKVILLVDFSVLVKFVSPKFNDALEIYQKNWKF